MPPPKREYNAVSTIADEIWQYRTGGNMIFDKDHDTAEEGRSRIASSPLEARFLQLSIRLRYN
jgi:hypothetical protein